MPRRSALGAAVIVALVGCSSPAPRTDAAIVDASSAVDGVVNDAARVPWALPAVVSRCAAPSDRATRRLSVTDSVPQLAIARGASDLGLAYIVRPTPPALAHLDFQRLALDGTPTGTPVRLGPIDMSVPLPVTLTHDGSAYVACTVVVGGASCFRVDASSLSSDAGMILDATAIAIANGPGGVMALSAHGGQLEASALGSTTAPMPIAATTSTPSIAATDTGYVVAYTIAGNATIVSLDAFGTPGTPRTLGPARTDGRVAIAFSAGAIGVSYIGANGDAMAAVVASSAVHVAAIGAGAMSFGQVSIARASDGFFATWSDYGGTIGGAFVDLVGARSGAAYMHAVAWDDDAHAVVATETAILLATNTMSSATPVDIARIGCP